MPSKALDGDDATCRGPRRKASDYDVSEDGYLGGLPPRVVSEFERRSEPVRVTVTLDRGALEDLETMVRFRHRGASRSAVIGYAVMWLRAKEAAWLLRVKAAEERAARLAEEESRRLAFDRAELERIQEESSVTEAVRWVTDEGASGEGARLDLDA